MLQIYLPRSSISFTSVCIGLILCHDTSFQHSSFHDVNVLMSWRKEKQEDNGNHISTVFKKNMKPLLFHKIVFWKCKLNLSLYTKCSRMCLREKYCIWQWLKWNPSMLMLDKMNESIIMNEIKEEKSII